MKTAFFILLLGTTSLSACRASMVNRPGADTPSRYDPVNENARGGVIKYLNAGASFVREKRRQDAYKQMYKTCNGKYRIDAEGPRTEGGVVIPAGDALIAATSEAWYIQFSCVRAAADSTQRLDVPD